MKVIPSIYQWKPNRSFKQKPSGIVIHAMSEYIHHSAFDWVKTINKSDHPEWMEASYYLNTRGLSVHGFIHPDGTVELGQDTSKVASHAGISVHNGLSGLNEYYLGFEILMPGKNLYDPFIDKMELEDWVTDEQFYSTFELCKQWMELYDISVDKVVMHSQVSGRDVRPKDPKYDPGKLFKYNTLISLLNG